MTAAIERWLLEEGRHSADPGELLDGMARRLVAVSEHMQAARGTDKAARILAEIATTGVFKP